MSHLVHRSLRSDPPLAVRGQGIYLYDAAGREIIDGSGGAAVACLGHGHPKVITAIKAQLDQLAYAHTALFSCESAERLADTMVGHAPGGLTHAYFCSSGSEGNEAAIKMARQYFLEIGEPRRVNFIARRQSYHGNTLGALSAGGNAMRRAPYQPILSRAFHHVSPCYPYRDRRDDESDAQYVARLIEELEAEFQRLGPDTVIGFMAETVVGATLGCAAALPGYFEGVKAVCDRHGALLILDEVMSGMGRCGTLHAWEQEGVSPDIQIVAKGLGGGYQPIGGILVHGRVIEGLSRGTGAFMHGHTYQAHPVACAAALAVQQVMAEENLLANVQAMGARLEQRLTERFGNHRHIGDIRGRGLFWAVEFVADRASKQVFDPALKVNERVKQEAFRRGLACYPMGGTIDGRQGDHAILAPPYIATPEQIDTIVERFGEAVDAVLAELRT
ncbi:aspartate aminotransferase family protein [Siccirubricoccus deserti]|uniref:Aspartate aminotransferase family protein n=1 Tax=Siccirubricoccus deserti TaxID=2013562 RepID=A0A9X0R0L9_9PROT|nr:aspartate aminotransferase family protein [Siccirubricoccus deserti]MBC4016673.1 aspartate aminotransferase family protein [Siccirubricoccus deserti]GGC51006.1 aspartate aminotransferase family protein [Siccirubricoccus deserti]